MLMTRIPIPRAEAGCIKINTNIDRQQTTVKHLKHRHSSYGLNIKNHMHLDVTNTNSFYSLAELKCLRARN